MQRFLRKGLRRGGLRFERLEDRWALAGNVFAQLDGGVLTLTGDTAENNVVITATDTEIVVQGVNTTVNGDSVDVSFDVALVNSVDIQLGQAKIPTRPRDPRGTIGVDRVQINGLDITGDLTIKGTHGGVVTLQDVAVDGAGEFTFGAGISAALPRTVVKTGTVLSVVDSAFADLSITTSTSNDVVSLVTTAVGGDLDVNTAAGIDVVTLNLIDVAGAATVNTGAGADQVVATDIVVNGLTTVNTGADVDTVNIASVTRTSTFHNDVVVDLGNGKFNELGIVGILPDGDPDTSLGVDIDGSLTVNALGTVDVIALAGVTVGADVGITTGNGVDVVAGTQLDVAGDLSINTGGGVDVVVLGRVPGISGRNTIGGATTINTGSGNDVVVLANTTFEGPVGISLSAGKDTLVMRDNEFNGGVAADGGSGLNTLINDASFDATFATNFRTRTRPNFINGLAVDFLLARANNWLRNVFG